MVRQSSLGSLFSHSNWVSSGVEKDADIKVLNECDRSGKDHFLSFILTMLRILSFKAHGRKDLKKVNPAVMVFIVKHSLSALR